MSKVRERLRTQRLVLDRRKQFGDFHPATFAAYGRAFVAWDGGIRAPAIDKLSDPEKTLLFDAYVRAHLRATGYDGCGNRRMRSHGRL